jgi:2-oxoglutarate ferredoxin oxidoreductase subunit alpha
MTTAGKRVLMKGNEALGEAAIRAGCRHYFGYPITPQNELPAYMAQHLPSIGGVFLQAESEIAAINMVIGAAAAGFRVLTSSSSPGLSLKLEGISYLAGMELPAVIANMVRGGPGLGNISPSQADYFQAVKGGGHGDYRLLVLAPSTVQELADLTMVAFEAADRYRNPVLILGDGLLGQIMEPLVLPEPIDPASLPAKPWALTGAAGRPKNLVKSLYLAEGLLEQHNYRLAEKYRLMEREIRFEYWGDDDAALVVSAFGSAARIARSAVAAARERGMKVGLFRPVTVYPFPSAALAERARGRDVLVVELNLGQMVEDVRLAMPGGEKVSFHGRPGGAVFTPEELLDVIIKRYPGRKP